MYQIVTQICSKLALCSFLLLSYIYKVSYSSTVQLNANNIQDILNHNELVFVNFYADWCRFSNILAPIFDETAQKVAEEFPQTGKVVLGKVDCDSETTVSNQYHITKYPTLKLFRDGQMMKKEYRGQRSAESLAGYLREQLKDNVKTVESLDKLQDVEKEKNSVIGYFEKADSANYAIFQRLARNLRDDCHFYAAFGDVAQPNREDGDRIVFRPKIAGSEAVYTGEIPTYETLQSWASDKCVPLVREITFENAEELTEEGLPFLILFHHPDDKEIVNKFTRSVISQILDERSNVNFLMADGLKFSHPLHHLGKTEKDLPVLAIDSFRHMYIYPTIEDIEQPGKLKQFVSDLHSGKLHREFHHGPDPASENPPQVEGGDDAKPVGDAADIPREDPEPSPGDAGTQEVKTDAEPSDPPESAFAKLAPSGNRYTILDHPRDEL